MVKDPNPWTPPQPLPEPVTTARLVVRLYRSGDGPELFRAVSEDRANLMPWMVWARTDHHTVEQSTYLAESFRRSAEKPDCSDYVMGIFERDSGALVGGTGLHRIDRGTRCAEIGYWVTSAARGQGLCTEAVGALVSSAMTPADDGGWGFRRIEIYNGSGNNASRRVCEKLGLRLEANRKQAGYLGPKGQDGAMGYHDVTGYAVLDFEWDYERNQAKPGIGWDSD